MNAMGFFSMAILVATIASIVLAVGSYAAYKLRDRRRPNRNFPKQELNGIVFFRRYVPDRRQAATGTDGAPAGDRDGR
ncbi:MAG: hypothetical protein ACE15D_01010 [Candidatus Eisenbacteria bacterium]|nr:hypothetical protein [Candidatus Eisenbacteria bacterium]